MKRPFVLHTFLVSLKLLLKNKGWILTVKVQCIIFTALNYFIIFTSSRSQHCEIKSPEGVRASGRHDPAAFGLWCPVVTHLWGSSLLRWVHQHHCLQDITLILENPLAYRKLKKTKTKASPLHDRRGVRSTTRWVDRTSQSVPVIHEILS